MGQHLLLTIRLHTDGQGVARYHGMAQGSPEWPPAPGRVFQALIAGVARGAHLPADATRALQWFESLSPPIIAAPRSRIGSQVMLFVPNNDADAVSDPRDISGIRTKKTVHPRLVEDDSPLLYAWALPTTHEHAESIVHAANDIYQLGRGVDMAWAVGEIVDDDALAERLHQHRGTVHRPELNGTGNPLPCPAQGTLGSLVRRHSAQKLRVEGKGRVQRTLFTNAPKGSFVPVAYEAASNRAVFELRELGTGKPWPWPMARTVRLTERLRDAAAARLREALPSHADMVEATLIGRKPGTSSTAAPSQRIRIVPLPSIGHEYADRGVRRVLIEIPSGTPLRAADVEWAFSGLEMINRETGELAPFVLIKAVDEGMIAHYQKPSRRWRSVTPLVLPESAKRRRIEPSRRSAEPKGAPERREEEARAVAAVHTALRHAGVHGNAVQVRVQREPFEAKGARVEAYSEGTRFSKERLWHVEVTLTDSIRGPLVLGDGRFLGLGLMAPLDEARTDQAGLYVLRLDPVPRSGMAVELARAVRRAVMTRVQEQLGDRALGRFFSGHEADGVPARGEAANHLAFQWDAVSSRMLVIAPQRLDRGAPREPKNLEVLDRALDALVELRAGMAGRFAVARSTAGECASLLRASRIWESSTPYMVTRHRKRSSVDEVIRQDVLAECVRRRLPIPKVQVLEHEARSGEGLTARVRLVFEVAVCGPLVLGRSRYLGGGLFGGVRDRDAGAGDQSRLPEG